MNISDDRLREFQDAYKEDFGDNISPAEAREMLSRLTTLYESLLRPLPDRPQGEDFTRRDDLTRPRNVRGAP
ncbi:MAG: hypothetical protein A2942_02485 [Candidatus Lloydbacteria bacterium RIFCSPLOWO2_01_FULL_50_20]|uniref:Uncharacterized protein n=1 Tax=Candidatus Lloydbacteria bacterium RIFCSPLOWO2_01_FULL_50_20 TaxID=1798665 RepID=A0A1G2DE02_9BACT|nr:MAG: hypothetical protein A2942_02485 [Candidatus Lloydbacteria bacterium RIFCSPLOWO2_01_FULL_50_20]